MVNSTALAPNSTVVNNNTCPLAPVPSTEVTDGPFNWNEQQQVDTRHQESSYIQLLHGALGWGGEGMGT